MVQGALQILQGLFEHITEDQWSTITHCPTRFRILQISIFKIKKQLDLLTNQITFSEMTSHLEQIYANFSALLEIFAPFKPGDFPLIYANRLSIPPNLKPFLTCSLHSSAMLSLAGVFKAFQKNLRRKPHVLYGENMYFECVHSVGKAAHAICVKEATEEHWKEVDLLLMQFNPSLIATMHAGYKSEQIEDVLRTCLRAKQGAPVTLALDCTFDLIDSPRVNTLLHKFQHEIKSGSLNIICYRSGNKFDLFGMDNYCGAPFIMINNREPQWDMFHSLLTDEVLQPDALTYRWFCLAYQCAAPQLELYRTQIFNNTRALLNKIPARLLRDATAHYRVLPMEEEMQPFFIDIKVLGFGHSLRGPSLVAGELCVRGMEEGHPILSRLSLGFYHPNLTVIFDEENCTIRLTLGLDPAQVDVFAKSFQRIDALNGRI